MDCTSTGLSLKNLPVRAGNYRYDESTSLVRECLMGRHACPSGGNGTGDALCGRGYEGPLCAICSSGFILGNGNQCVECASARAVASLTVPLIVLSALVVVIALACFADVVKPFFEYLWHTFGGQSRICWTMTQILAHLPVMLSTLLPSTLAEFYRIFLQITDFNPFAAFGLSCANHALRSFKTRLLVTVIGPVVVSAALLAFAILQVRVLGRDSNKCFTRYARLQLIVIFLVLPSVCVTLFRAFLCDDGFVDNGSVSFLEADLTLSCESSEWRQLVAVAIVGLVLYPCGCT